MRQAYFITTLGTESGVSGEPICRLRAASSPVPADQYQSLSNWVKFQPPLPASSGSSAQTRLALIQTPDYGRLVCHAVVAVADGVSSHPPPADQSPANGIPLPPGQAYGFSHVFMEVPATTDAQQVITSWESELWQRRDPGGSNLLPDALFLPTASVLDDAALTRFLQEEEHRELLEFLLSAYLTTPASSRIFIAAPANVVALAIYGLTRAIPLSLLEGLTFSTYESDVNASGPRIVGTYWPEDADRDLPATCYDGLGVGFNLRTGTKTAVNTELPFVRFAVQQLASGQPKAFDEFCTTWQRLGVKSIDMLDLVYRLDHHPQMVTKEESQRALQDHILAAWLATKPDVPARFLPWALEDVNYATAIFSKMVAGLRQQPAVLQQLGAKVQEESKQALIGGQVSRLRTALEVILPMIAPAKARTVWQELFQGIPDPSRLSWEMRAYLLPWYARQHPLASGQTLDAEQERWLDIPIEHLAAFLTLDLPASYQIAGLLKVAQSSEQRTPLAQVLAQQPALVLPMLNQLSQSADGMQRAIALFETLTQVSTRAWLDDLVRHGKTLQPVLLDRCMLVAMQAPATDVRGLIRNHGPQLLELISGTKSLDRLAELLLEQNGDELIEEEALAQFLDALMAHPGLGPNGWSRLDAAVAMKGFFKHPSLHEDTLKQIHAAFKLEPPLFSKRILEKTIKALGQLISHDPADAQAKLETVLMSLGDRVEGGPTGLYRQLFQTLSSSKEFWKKEELLLAFMALSLDASQSDQVNAALNDLDAEAYRLVQGMKQHGGTKLLQTLDAKTTTWPRSARRQWGFLIHSEQEPPQPRALRDVCMLAAGMLIAAGAFWLWQWLN